MITIDGVTYNFPCDIDREVELRASDISGFLLNNEYYNDILASYLKYTIKMAIPINQMADYALLYETLTDPVAEHTFVMPYNQTTKSFRGRIETISDSYYKGIWRATSFSVISNEPLKEAQ